VAGTPVLAEAIKGASESVKEYVAGAVEVAAHTEGLPRLRIADFGFRIRSSATRAWGCTT
jgi:hypothetical protein